MRELSEYLYLARIANTARKLTLIVFMASVLFMIMVFKVDFHLAIIACLTWFLITAYIFDFLYQGARDTEQLENILLAQSFSNLAVMAVIVYFVGTTEWLGAMFFLFEIIYANIILPRRKGVLIAAMAFVALAGLDSLEYYNILPHHKFVHADMPIRDSNFRVVYIYSSLLVYMFVAYASGMFTKILKERTTQLRSANEQLSELAKQKSDFVANVSHELKEPITATLFNLENLIDGLLGQLSEKQVEILRNCKKVLLRLSRLASDLLEVSKIEAGKLKLRREIVHTREFIDELHDAILPIAQKKNITLRRTIQERIPNFWADRDKTYEALFNLVDNAIKYSPDNSTVDIIVLDEPTDLKFIVQDRGKGMSELEIHKLFNKFERLYEEKEAGTGLGLCIAKDIVELHRGKIWVESKPGEGSKFIFTLPKDLRRQLI